MKKKKISALTAIFVSVVLTLPLKQQRRKHRVFLRFHSCPSNICWFSVDDIFWKTTTDCHNPFSSPEPRGLTLMLPDQIKLVVPGIDIEDRPNSNHVVVTVSHVLNILVLQRHLAEQLKLVRGSLENLLCRVETIHQQRPPTRALVLQAVKHLDAARARESKAQDIGPQGPRQM